MTDWSSRRYQPRYYKLVGTLVVPVDDMMEWARSFENFDGRRVLCDEIDGAVVSTVFLGLDHRLSFDDDDLEPLVFETMIFPTEIWNYYQTRCSSYEEALAMHHTACDAVRKTQRQLPVVQQEENGNA